MKIPVLIFAFALGVVFVDSAFAQNAKLFEYDNKTDFGMTENSSKTENGIVVRDISFAALNRKDERVAAYLVKPETKGKYAAVLFFHWLGDKNSSREEFLEEAKILAKKGVISLLIDGYFPWKKQPSEPQADKREVINQAIEARRALDFLLSQKEVDKSRVAFVGHDYGAMYGAILAGIERRVKNYVLIAGMGNFSDWSLKFWKEPKTHGEENYRRTLSEVDPVNYLPKANSANFLFQFAEKDAYISKEKADEFSKAARRAEIKFYDAGHDLNVEAAKKDRLEWLSRQLKLFDRTPKN